MIFVETEIYSLVCSHLCRSFPGVLGMCLISKITLFHLFSVVSISDDLREHLKNAPKEIMSRRMQAAAAAAADAAEDSSSDSDSSSSDDSDSDDSSSSSDSD